MIRGVLLGLLLGWLLRYVVWPRWRYDGGGRV